MSAILNVSAGSLTGSYEMTSTSTTNSRSLSFGRGLKVKPTVSVSSAVTDTKVTKLF